MESLLRAAENVFAEVGYERATTNLIASRASVSPGTLYQFYKNKEAMAEALAERYAQDQERLHATALDVKIAAGRISQLIDATIDPFLDFHRGAPAFEALFLAATVTPELARRIEILHETVASRIVALYERWTPRASREELRWAAETSVALVRGMLPLINRLTGARRTRAIRELKTALGRYLEPILTTKRR